MPLAAGTLLGRYEILSPLGSGGMGEVYRARDRRLDRVVAVKVLSDQFAREAGMRQRFESEARAVAALSHPNILAIHDFANEGELWFAVTELLEGETLRQRLERGPLVHADAVALAKSIAEGLAAAHQRGVIHRDLKPENVFLTADGRVKILDFGLASIRKDSSPDAKTELQTVARVMGTPGYMAPEQLRAQPTSPATDVFAFGCVLYEMLTGSRPFSGTSHAEYVAAVLKDEPRSLPRSLGVPRRLEKIIRRCLQKEPAHRYSSVEELRAELAGALGSSEEDREDRATRVIVLPFRMLRANPEVDFLAYSLPEAITSSLSALGSIVVRSMAAASRYADAVPDLGRIAAEQDVNAILTGSILPAADQLRVNAQLIEAPGGTLRWSHSAQTSLGDIFQVQDELTRRIVDSLAVPLTEGESRALKRDAPRSALGYEFFLRANQQGHGPEQWMVARDLYLRCLEEDPQFAPAWARLGRCYWLIGKYTEETSDNWSLAENALKRALEINPDFSLADRLYAELELDLGRALHALERLLPRLAARRNDAETHTAAVKVFRYCGLLDESLAADTRTRQLDPRAITSVAHTHFMRGDYERALQTIERDIRYLDPLCLVMLGRREEALEKVRQRVSEIQDRRFRAYPLSLLAILEGDSRRAAEAVHAIVESHRDPEAMYYGARSLAFVGETTRALELLRTIVQGFFCLTTFQDDPWLDSLRGTTGFSEILEEARSRNGRAVSLWRESGLAIAAAS